MSATDDFEIELPGGKVPPCPPQGAGADGDPSVSDRVAGRVRQLRMARRWSARQMAEECRQRGHTSLTNNIIENIEHGRAGDTGARRRKITVDELVAFADLFDVRPEQLLTVSTICSACQDTPPSGFICAACGNQGEVRP